jgi:hypothetical protein
VSKKIGQFELIKKAANYGVNQNPQPTQNSKFNTQNYFYALRLRFLNIAKPPKPSSKIAAG